MSKARVNINRTGIQALLTSPGTERLIASRTEAIEDACNSQSSWGGYASATSTEGDRVRGRAWSYARQDGKGKTERAQRMIRNLDAQ